MGLSARLEARIEEGDLYEALQLYKTSYSRYLNQGSPEKLEEARVLLRQGAIAMAKHSEVSCRLRLLQMVLLSMLIARCPRIAEIMAQLTAAAELGLLLVTSFEEGPEMQSDDFDMDSASLSDWKEEVLSDKLLPIAQELPTCPEKIAFLKVRISSMGVILLGTTASTYLNSCAAAAIPRICAEGCAGGTPNGQDDETVACEELSGLG